MDAKMYSFNSPLSGKNPLAPPFSSFTTSIEPFNCHSRTWHEMNENFKLTNDEFICAPVSREDPKIAVSELIGIKIDIFLSCKTLPKVASTTYYILVMHAASMH